MEKQPKLQFYSKRDISFLWSRVMKPDALRAFLNHVRNGSDQLVTGPWISSLDEGKRFLEEWLDHIDRAHLFEGLREHEFAMASKVGPMSIMKPLAERMDSIKEYYGDVLLPSEPISDAAVHAVVCEFGDNSLRLKSLDNTINDMKKSTSAGLPDNVKRKYVVDEAKWHINAFNMLQGAENRFVRDFQLKESPALLGWRGQEGGPNVTDVKQRTIWMFPFWINILELRAYQSLIKIGQTKNLVPAWVSNDAVDKRVTTLFDTKGRKDLVVCTDFTRFDQHFNKDMQHAAYSVLSEMFCNLEGFRWLREVFPLKYNIPLMISEDQVLTGAHGMASGSGGTNADETLAHRALQWEAAQSSGHKLNQASMCLGDDGIISYPSVTIEQVVDCYRKHGQEMNESKQSASDVECVYLRRWYHKDYRPDGLMRGVYATTRALGRLLYQERFYDPEVWGPRAVCLRQLSILENLRWHPLREEFAAWCMKKDEYRLGLDIPGFFNDISSEFEKFKRDIPSAVGYNAENLHPSSINDWWILQYLKSKR